MRKNLELRDVCSLLRPNCLFVRLYICSDVSTNHCLCLSVCLFVSLFVHLFIDPLIFHLALQVTALAEAEDWSELEKFSNNKISAKFGGEQLIDVCLQYNNKFEAKKYLPKVSKVVERILRVVSS